MLEEASLSRAQLKIGMKWMNHLPQHFHQELIGKPFLELNQVHTIGMLQEHHNQYMRCNIKDSSALKSFVGLNDAQYVRLLQALFYFAGMRVLAPIKGIYRLRAKKIEEDYTTLSTWI